MFGKIGQRYLQRKQSEILKVKNRRSITKITLMKAFGIIAVVASHTKGGAIVFPMSNWVSPYFYFMPFFVFVSGYLYNEKCDESHSGEFVLKKIKSLVLPYFLWNVFYGVLNYLLRYEKVICYGDDINFHSLFVRPWIDGHQFHFNIPAWFLLTLFIDTMLIFVIRKVLKKLKIFSDAFVLLLTFIISVFSICYAQQGYNYGMHLCFVKVGFMLPYFQLGFVCKKREQFITRIRHVCLPVLFLVIGLVLMVWGDVNAQVVFGNFTGSPIVITLLTTASILSVAIISEILAPAFENNVIVKLVGDNSFTIMMHHGIIIFAVNFFLYLLSKLIDFTSFNVETFKNTLWYVCLWKDARIYIVYVIVGITVPVLLKLFYEKCILWLCNRIEKQQNSN